MKKKKLKILIKNEKRLRKWFDAYQDVDVFLFFELGRKGLDFPIKSQKHPQKNTIAAIKLLIKNKKK